MSLFNLFEMELDLKFKKTRTFPRPRRSRFRWFYPILPTKRKTNCCWKSIPNIICPWPRNPLFICFRKTSNQILTTSPKPTSFIFLPKFRNSIIGIWRRIPKQTKNITINHILLCKIIFLSKPKSCTTYLLYLNIIKCIISKNIK